MLTRRVVPYWLVRLRTMPLFLSRSLMMAERLAATLAAASFLAATCRSPLCVEADRGNPNIFLHAPSGDIQPSSGKALPFLSKSYLELWSR